MTYASAYRRPNPAALAGALGIPGAFGALLVVGLAVTVATAPDKPRLEGRQIADIPLPPPPPPQPDPARTDSKTKTPANPSGPITIAPGDFVIGDPLLVPLPWPGEVVVGNGAGSGDAIIPQPTPGTTPFKPVGAAPRNNPGRWVTNDDYRPRWIREDMAGTAAFTLAIDAGGKVTGCTVTRSTGHAPLDAATCELVTKRARFDAARDSSGRPVAGSYSGSVTWQIP